jgi:hypothetical protein
VEKNSDWRGSRVVEIVVYVFNMYVGDQLILLNLVFNKGQEVRWASRRL